MRDEIVASWGESLSFGLRPDCFAPRSKVHLQDADEQLPAAKPVVERLAADLHNTDIGVVLTDERTQVLASHARRPLLRPEHDALRPGYVWTIAAMGTNAIGMTSTSRSSTTVDAHEHFMDALADITMASAPIVDPRSGRLAGAVTLACPAHDANVLLVPLARRAAHEVEQRLLDGRTAQQQRLDERFRAARRRTRGPLALVNEDTLLMNAAAARVFDSTDQARLWSETERALTVGRTTIELLAASDGSRIMISIEPLHAGGEAFGALLRFKTSPGSSRARNDRELLGWASLTETERCLAELLADGLTNKEAAARLIVSPHTIDSHLRHIFAKLDINSRVELARLVATRTRLIT